MLIYYNEEYIIINKCKVTTFSSISWQTKVKLLLWTLCHDKQMLIYYNEQYIMLTNVKLLHWRVYHEKELLWCYNEQYNMINKCYVITMNIMSW